MLLSAATSVFMLRYAHEQWVEMDKANGFGSDFHGTIWAPDRALLDGDSPYPSPSAPFAIQPAVYLPPIFLVTLPLALIPLHAATWVWLALLVASLFGLLAVLEVRDPRCYALVILSLPFVQALVLGNAGILVAFGVALSWRCRHHPLFGPLAVAATVAVKFWLWPLFFWLFLINKRSGVRAAITFGAMTLVAWSAIGFEGLREYPDLMRTEVRLFAPDGVLYVGALIDFNMAATLAAAVGLVAALVLLGAAWIKRSSELVALSLALLASLVATPVAWPHYLVISAIPLIINWPRLSLAWAWFPALWLAGQTSFLVLNRTSPFCVFAALPIIAVIASQISRRDPLSDRPGSPQPTNL